MWEASSSPTSTAARVGRRPTPASRSTSSASSARIAAATAFPSSTLAAIGPPTRLDPSLPSQDFWHQSCRLENAPIDGTSLGPARDQQRLGGPNRGVPWNYAVTRVYCVT